MMFDSRSGAHRRSGRAPSQPYEGVAAQLRCPLLAVVPAEARRGQHCTALGPGPDAESSQSGPKAVSRVAPRWAAARPTQNLPNSPRVLPGGNIRGVIRREPAWLPRACGAAALGSRSQPCYNASMFKRLQIIGNSSGLIIDKPILELLKITADTELEVTTDGERLIVTPIRADASRRDRVAKAQKKVLAAHERTFRKLAK